MAWYWYSRADHRRVRIARDHSAPACYRSFLSALQVLMRRVVLLLLLAPITAAVNAGHTLSDVRLGVPCDEIAAAQTREGLLDTTDHGTQRIMRYAGSLGGQTATVIFRCDDGRLAEHIIMVAHTNRDEAFRFAEEQKKELTEHLGQPIHDGMELSIWKRFYFGFMGADLDYLTRIVAWGKTKKDVMLLVRETESARWEVSVSQGSSKTEFLLNL